MSGAAGFGFAMAQMGACLGEILIYGRLLDSRTQKVLC
jgi:hypothetical protein